MAEPVDYRGLIKMIKAFKEKYSRDMKAQECITYISIARNISQETATKHLKAMLKQQKLYLDNGCVVVNG